MCEQTVLPVDPENEGGPLPNRARGSTPFCRKFRREATQPRRSKRLPFEPLQDLRKEKESFGIARDPVNDRLRLLPQGAENARIDCEKDKSDAIGSAREVIPDARRGTKRENRSGKSPRRFG